MVETQLLSKGQIVPTKNTIMSSETRAKRPYSSRFDISFFLMGAFFIAMAFSEYLYTGGSGKDRFAVKLLNGGQVLFSILVVLLNHRLHVLKQWLPASLILLAIWLSVVDLIYSQNILSTGYRWLIYLYWLALFLFFNTKCSGIPYRLQFFLIMASASLVVWLPALFKFSAIHFNAKGIPVEMQAQNYVGYYVVALFPYVLMLNRKIIKTIAILLISYGAVYSLKRGVVLSLVLMGFAASCVHFLFISKRKGKVAVVIIFMWVTAFGAGSLFVYKNPDAVARRVESNTGRREIYSLSLKAIAQAEIYELLIGNGGGRLQDVVGHEAHNDWVLLLYDYGTIGVLLMLNVYAAMIFLIWKLCRLKSPLALPLVSAFVLMMCVQMYSTGIYLKLFGYITGCIGIVSGSFPHANRFARSNLGLKRAYNDSGYISLEKIIKA